MAIVNYLEHSPQIGKRVYIDKQASVIGRVWIGDDASIWPMVAIRGDVSEIHIGAGTNVQDGSVLHVTAHTKFTGREYPLIIGEGVTIGHNATLHACTVGDESLVGMGAVVLDGVEIQKHVLVAAGCVVPPGKTLESGFLYRGNPAVQARKLTDKELEYLSFSREHYQKLKDQYIAANLGETY